MNAYARSYRPSRGLLRSARTLIICVFGGLFASCSNNTNTELYVKKELIGAPFEYLIQEFGNPKIDLDGSYYYETAGCKVGYQIQEGKVIEISVNLENECELTFDGASIQSGATVGTVIAAHQNTVATIACMDCGNAADPTIAVFKGGSRASNFLKVEFSTEYQDSGQVVQEWMDTLKQTISFEPPLSNSLPKCDAVMGAELFERFKQVRISTLRLYSDLNESLDGDRRGNCLP